MILSTQAYNIKVCDNCDCETACKPNRIARLSDKFSLQLPLLNFRSKNKITNGDFPSDLSGWSQSGGAGTIAWVQNAGKAEQDLNGAEVGKILYQQLPEEICKGDLLTLDYSGTYKLNVLYSTNGITWYTWDSFTTGTSISILFDETLIGANYIGFQYEGDTGSARYIDNIIYYKQFIEIDIIDCCNNSTVKFYDSCSDDEITIYDNYIDIIFKWSDAVSVNGQYRVCFDVPENTDPCFENTTQTGTGVSWSFGDCEAALDMGGAAGQTSKTAIMEMNIPKCPFNLNIHTDLTKLVSNADVHLMIYGNDVFLYDLIIASGINNYSFDITPEYEITELRFYVQIDDLTTEIFLDISEIYILNTYCTDCISVEDAKCSLLFEATNNSDAFELYSTYQGVMRLFSNLFKLKPVHTEKIYRNVAGSYTNVYTDIAEKYELEIYTNHKDVIFGIILLLSFDNLLIDKKEFVKCEGTIEVDWDSKEPIGSFKCELYPKNQLREKTFI